MKKVLYGIGSALFMVVLGLAVFMLFLVVPEREAVGDTVAMAEASAESSITEEEPAGHADNHARRSADESESAEAATAEEEEVPEEEELSGEEDMTEEEDSAGEEDLSEEEDSAGEEDLSEDEDAAGEEDLSGDEDAAGEEDLSGDEDSVVEEEDLSGDEDSAEDEDGTEDEDSTEDEDTSGDEGTTDARPNEGVATRDRTTGQQEQTTAGAEQREDRTATVIENPVPARTPATQQSTDLNTGNMNSYMSVSVTDFGGGSYEATTAPVGGGTFFNVTVSARIRLTIDVISDVRTINGIEGTPAGDGQYTHVLTEETNVTIYPDASGYGSTKSYWSVDRNDRLTITSLKVSLVGVNSVSGSVDM